MSTLELVPNREMENFRETIDAFDNDLWFRKKVGAFEFAPFVRKSELKEGDMVRIHYAKCLGMHIHGTHEPRDCLLSVLIIVRHEVTA